MQDKERRKQEKEIKNSINSMSEEDLAKMKDDFTSAYVGLIKKETDILSSLNNKADILKLEERVLWDEQRAATYPESSEIMRRRMVLNTEISNIKYDALNQKNIVLCLENGGTIVATTDAKGFEHDRVSDFRKIDTNQIDFDIDEILTAKKPPYIPYIDEKSFSNRGYVFDAIRTTRDTYIVAIKAHKEESITHYVLVTLDQLVLITDYYYTRAKAENIKSSAERNKSAEERYDKMPDERKKSFLEQKNQQYVYKQIPAKIKKEVDFEKWITLTWQEKDKLHKFYKRAGVKRLKSKLKGNYMWLSFHQMYERFVDPSAIQPKKGAANKVVFEYWTVFRDMMEYKILDIKIQRQDLSEIRKAAIETSFGESNTDDVLKEKYGVLVKRQNGDKINPVEIEQIKDSLVSIEKVFGNLKPNFLKYNIKISHTGIRYVFASKAVGMYIPSMGSVSVSDKYGDNQFRMTMAHEFAHFIDNFIGELNGKRYATDNYESTAGKIAFAFRDAMNKPKETQGEYTNATKECFARALEQYYGIESFGAEAGVVFSDKPLDKKKAFFVADDFAPLDAYSDKIKPLIKQFFKENSDVFEYTVDVDETNEVVPVGDEKEASAESNIERLKIIYNANTTSSEEKQQLNEAIEAIEVLESLDVGMMGKGGIVKNENGKIDSVNLDKSYHTTKEYRDELNRLMKIALNGQHLSISVSETNFGVSMYIQDYKVKMRFSDHSVGHKRFGEDLNSLDSIFDSPNIVIDSIKRNFSDDYTFLVVKDGNKGYNVGRINKKELKNWNQVVVESTKEVERAIPLTDIDNYKIVKNTNILTKKGDKVFAIIEAPSFNRGVINIKTGEIRSVHAPVMKFEITEGVTVVKKNN